MIVLGSGSLMQKSTEYRFALATAIASSVVLSADIIASLFGYNKIRVGMIHN